jgi:hypothetical protein
MKRASRLFNVAQFVLLLLLGTEERAVAQATNLSHPDNLMQTHRLRCITVNQVKNTYSPADISRAIVRCAKRAKFDQAMQLFFIYSVYGSFDQARMKDRTATSAIGALNHQIFKTLSAQPKAGLQQAAKRMEDSSGPFFRNTCTATKMLGPPAYVPYYMLAHGMSAFKIVGDKAQYVPRDKLSKQLKNVNTAKLWKTSLHDRNGCPR